MKRVISIIVLISVILIASTVLASSAKVNVTAPKTIEEGTDELVMTVSLGAFQDLEENQTLGFQATLEYSKDIFESVKVEGLNGWDVSYEESSKTVIGLIKSSKANVDIAKFTFTVKDDVKAGSTDNILLNNFILSNDDTLNQEENYNVQVSVIEAPGTENPGEGTENTTGKDNVVTGNNIAENEIVNNTVQNNTINNNVINDNTIKNTGKLPAAGIRNTIIISAVIIFLAGLGFIIRSKSIKLK